MTSSPATPLDPRPLRRAGAPGRAVRRPVRRARRLPGHRPPRARRRRPRALRHRAGRHHPHRRVGAGPGRHRGPGRRRRRPARVARRRGPRARPAARPSTRPPARWSCCRCCTARWARTARCRACSSSPACPTSAAACSARPWRWTRSTAKQIADANGFAQTAWRGLHRSDLLPGELGDRPGPSTPTPRPRRHRRRARGLAFPIFVKPANMGSSIGVVQGARRRRAPRRRSPPPSSYDEWIVVEEGVVAREIEVAVLGHTTSPRASVPGEIVPGADFYDYEDKYVDGVADLLIPAPLPDDSRRGRPGPGLQGRSAPTGPRAWPGSTSSTRRAAAACCSTSSTRSRASPRSRCTRCSGRPAASPTGP